MNAVELKKNVYWVGVKDHNLKVFDIVMPTGKGTTYNSYLIVDEKIALIDTVKDGFYDDFKSKIKEIIGDKKIDYLIVNHTEPDHSGCVERILNDYEGIEVVASKAALLNLKNITNRDFKGIEAKGELNLGKRTLKFISAPLLHWPDTIFTFDEYDKILFTCDAFGSHYCGDSIFNDENEDFSYYFKYYYDGIMSPFKKNIISAVEKIKPLNFDMIAVSHGPVLRKNPMSYVNKYYEWSNEGLNTYGSNYAVVYYVSAYGYTKSLANAIAEGIKEAGAKVDVYDISSSNMPELVSKMDKAKALAIGSSTINQDAVKPVWDFLSMVSPITNRGKIAFAFGSYGWSGEAVGMLTERLKSLKFKVIEPGMKVCFKPTEKDLKNAKEYGLKIGRAIME
ncbi:MAG TPA: MBL fold metallo-hydrolase [Clostridiaceae bacterium]|jgi:flavorubredoxin|nr:MBL fold metallo-hydrolase [Clostridiaceae bacterium]HBN28445.1 MBL fold metallo-hydrolase [Clostridiaceae bacterium]HBX48342.1 MBL fold metallo-hydrolase [Clostridiaceae bacterium]HCL49804.1 MBL fold metallo-hydrolase [Clostridiaceae bacterium]